MSDPSDPYRSPSNQAGQHSPATRRTHVAYVTFLLSTFIITFIFSVFVTDWARSTKLNVMLFGFAVAAGVMALIADRSSRRSLIWCVTGGLTLAIFCPMLFVLATDGFPASYASAAANARKMHNIAIWTIPVLSWVSATVGLYLSERRRKKAGQNE